MIVGIIDSQYKLPCVVNSSPAFGGVQTKKLIEKVANTKQLQKLDIKFDELERMFNEIGYNVIYKGGSHAIIKLNENTSISITIPHGKKQVSPYDLKRFLLIKEGKFEEATKV